MIQFIEDISSLSDSQLIDYSVQLAHHETEVGLRLINCLRETERRMLYLALGYSSLWDFATRHLGLSNGNAQLKIDAMRLSAREKIESGELTLVNAAKVNRFFRQEKKAGKTYTPEQKAQVIQSVMGLSQSKCERTLMALAPESIPTEKVRPLTDTKTELKIVVDEETLTLLNRLKELVSNQIPQATYAELLKYLAHEQVKILEKKQRGVAKTKETEQPAPTVGVTEATGGAAAVTGATEVIGIAGATEVARVTGAIGPDPLPSKNSGQKKPARSYISIHDRRWVMSRAEGQCEFVSQDGKRCSSRRYLQIDHIVPIFYGGRNERSNYRAACSLHNIYYVRKNLGPWMSDYVPSLK